MISEENKFSGSHTVTFTETVWHERVREFARFLAREIPLFAAITIAFWGVAEVLAEIGGEQITLGALAVPAILTALVVSVHKAYQRYRAWVPEALVSESKSTQEIFRKGNSGWQFALARQMLSERLDMSDRTLSRVKLGSEFILPKRLPNKEYWEWLHDRSSTMLRLIRAVAVQCVNELPAILGSTKSEEELADLKSGVEQLAALYKVAAEFEVDCHSVQPPEPFENLHKMTHGWTDPIRDGVRDFMAILAQLAAIDRADIRSKKASAPKFNIDFKAPPVMSEFVTELKSIDPATVAEIIRRA